MMFINEHDVFRKYYGLGKKKAENCVIRNISCLSIPIPALGEALHKIREKTGDKWEVSLKEMNRLMSMGFLNITYRRDYYDIFGLAKELCMPDEDGRNVISGMDALIAATAAVDSDCTTLYTTDSKLISDMRLNDVLKNWREEHGVSPLKITDLSSIIR